MEDRDITDLCTQFPKTEVAAVKSVPQDMRASIDFGLPHLECSQTLCPEDRWLVAPADLPTLNADIINSVCTAAEPTKLPVVPFYGVKQGHPVSLGIEHIKSFRDIPVDHGLNSILQEGSYEKLDLPSSWRPRDMDTRQEYEARLRGD